MNYKYETHMHTAGPSACASSTGAEQAVFMKEQGYTGIIITDHFYNGNTGIDRSLPWPEFVEGYCSGYELAKAKGDEIGLDVFFGIEWNFNNDEYLLYGVSKQWLLDNPDMLSWDHSRLFAEINKIGGLMVQAHPFRDRPYVGKIHLHPEQVHAIELVNSGNDPRSDRMAAVYAKHFGLKTTAGSDLHRSVMPERGLKGVLSPVKFESIFDYVNLIKYGEYELAITPEDLLPLRDDDVSPKPIEMLGADGRDRTAEIIELLGNRFAE